MPTVAGASVRAVRAGASTLNGAETVGPLLIHQDAFAVDYEEYELLGMAIKYAGLYGKEVRIIGKNRETLSKAAAN